MVSECPSGRGFLFCPVACVFGGLLIANGIVRLHDKRLPQIYAASSTVTIPAGPVFRRRENDESTILDTLFHHDRSGQADRVSSLRRGASAKV